MAFPFLLTSSVPPHEGGSTLQERALWLGQCPSQRFQGSTISQDDKAGTRREDRGRKREGAGRQTEEGFSGVHPWLLWTTLKGHLTVVI